MRLIAFIFLSIFIAVQTGPAIKTCFEGQEFFVFNPDEEKGAENVKIDNIEENNEKKTDLPYYSTSNQFSPIISLNTLLERNIEELPTPHIDQFTPPPNQ